MTKHTENKTMTDDLIQKEKVEEILNRFDNVLTEVNPRDTEYSKIAKDFTNQIYELFSSSLHKIKDEAKREAIEEKEGDLVSNCCAADFNPLGYEKEEGIWQEKCLNCGKLCEPLYLSERNIKIIQGLNSLKEDGGESE